MKVTFPHLGQVHLIIRLIFKALGIQVVIPPENTEITLEKGKEISPEEMCLPFKFMAGNLIQAYEAGARKVIMPATMGPCRLGEYGELLRQVLKLKGYNFQWVLIDNPAAIGMREWFRRICLAAEGKKVTYAHAVVIVLRGVRLMKKLDDLEAKAKYISGYAKYPAECVTLLQRTRNKLAKASNLQQGFQLVHECSQALDVLSVNPDKDPVKLLVTGEIYTLIEPSANQRLEDFLMSLGCSIKRRVTISWWIKQGILPTRTNGQYLPHSIGGFARETVDEVLKNKEDGVIKIMPSGCMPEIVAKAVCNRISEDKGIKILNLIFDEMQGRAGYETRVEAFVDMLERRKHALSGH